ncbi:hypothetical protein E2C01_019408 [Portunus trituberculatus]|uniref:Uncharacterized protein n=1 Tax=Portunus trituberculatus TaxID=210409 RepID=A0A5B7DZB9_PORTR|nr:hypothetical protein [Portunus trituberculatus]
MVAGAMNTDTGHSKSTATFHSDSCRLEKQRSKTRALHNKRQSCGSENKHSTRTPEHLSTWTQGARRPSAAGERVSGGRREAACRRSFI